LGGPAVSWLDLSGSGSKSARAPLLLCCLQGFGCLANTRRIELDRRVLAGAGAPFPRGWLSTSLPLGDRESAAARAARTNRAQELRSRSSAAG